MIKEHYGFTYPQDFDAMFRCGFLAVKAGDAINTEDRWKNSDISGANESRSKQPLWVRKDLKGINRDYDYRQALASTWPQNWKELSGRGTEWHGIPIDNIPKELIANYQQNNKDNFSKATQPIINWINDEVDKVFSKFDKDNIKRVIKLRDLQEKVVKRVKKVLRKKGVASTIIAELAPRFGKTFLFLSMFSELSDEFGHRVMMVPAYWLGAIASYRKAVGKWRNYQDMVFIDTNVDDNCEQTFTNALENGFKVVVGVSLFGSFEDFKKKNAVLHDYTDNTLFVPEEADFGAWCPNQVEKQDWLCENKKVTKIVTSGTNIERMSSGVNDVVDVIRVPYSLLEQSDDPNIVIRQYYQVYVSERIQQLVKDYSGDDRPSWTKILDKGNANTQFIKSFFEAIYGYETQYGLSIDGAADEQIVCSMVWLGVTKKEHMKTLVDILQPVLEDHVLKIISGDTTNGRSAEDDALQVLRDAKNGVYGNKKKVIFFSMGMGARSFSVGDVQATLFLTDGGSAAQFSQKDKRCVTPLDDHEKILVSSKKYGHIFSFSFDPNRTETSTLSLLKESKAVQAWFQDQGLDIPGSKDNNGIVGGIRYVMNSINLKRVGFIDEAKIIQVDPDEFINELSDTEAMLKVAEVSSHDKIPNMLDDENLADILETLKKMPTISKSNRDRIEEIISRGKTYGGLGNGQFTLPKESQEAFDALKLIKTQINTINHSSTTVLQYTNYTGTTFEDCLNIIAGDIELDNNFMMYYNVSCNDILKFLPYLELELLDICVHNQR
jgi:hypothetical protein